MTYVVSILYLKVSQHVNKTMSVPHVKSRSLRLMSNSDLCCKYIYLKVSQHANKTMSVPHVKSRSLRLMSNSDLCCKYIILKSKSTCQ